MNTGNSNLDKLLKLFLTLEEKNIALAFNMAKALQLDFEKFLFERYTTIIEMHEVNMDQSREDVVRDFIEMLQRCGNSWLMWYNKVTELPNEIGDFTHVTKLSIYGEPLKYISDGLYRLKNLTDLEIRRSEEGILPTGLYDLLKLTKLHFLGEINHIEEGISGLTELDELQLSFADNVPFPMEICQMSHLNWLILTGSNFKDIPEEISHLYNLSYFGILNSDLTKIPNDLVLPDGRQY